MTPHPYRSREPFTEAHPVDALEPLPSHDTPYRAAAKELLKLMELAFEFGQEAKTAREARARTLVTAAALRLSPVRRLSLPDLAKAAGMTPNAFLRDLRRFEARAGLPGRGF